MSIITELAAIQQMDAKALREKWRELFDTDPPVYPKAILVKRLSYRIQELTYGGLSQQAKAKLDRLIKKDSPKLRVRAKTRPPVGTKFLRIYKGVEHQVTVTESGFEYQGMPYRSLSAIAREITGAQWNGPVFFGAHD